MDRVSYESDCVKDRVYGVDGKIELFLKTPYDFNSLIKEGYSRGGSLNTVALCDTLSRLYETEKEILLVSSGMSAVYTVLSTLDKGATVVVPMDIYFEDRELLELLSINTIYADFDNKESLTEIIKKNKIDLILFDSVCNIIYRWNDTKEIVKIVKAYSPDTKVCVDNTLLTSYYYNPLKDGADIVIESLTKYSCGHGDALGGAIIGSNDVMRMFVFRTGLILNPFSAYLIQRGVATLPLRLKRITETSNEVYSFLKKEGISALYYGKGGLISFTLGDNTANKEALQRSPLANGGSFGQDVTLITQLAGNFLPKKWRACLRISIGLEDSKDIINALKITIGR